MAREIKFRVWFPRDKHMMSNEDLLLSDMPIETLLVDFGSESPKTVMQYTGLTDKNGKEIYEGDALGYVDDSLKLGVVKYESHGFIIDWGKDCHMSKHILNLSDRFEVIGNIHENPELLGGEL